MEKERKICDLQLGIDAHDELLQQGVELFVIFHVQVVFAVGHVNQAAISKKVKL